MNKLIDAVVNGYDSFLEQGCSITTAIIFTVSSLLLGIAWGLGINLLWAYGIMFIYNNLANFYHWPVFSIWFWFIGLYVLKFIGQIMFPNNR